MHWNPPPPELFSLSMQAALRQQGKLQPHSLLAVTGIHLLVCKSMSKTHLTPQLPLKPLNTHTHTNGQRKQQLEQHWLCWLLPDSSCHRCTKHQVWWTLLSWTLITGHTMFYTMLSQEAAVNFRVCGVSEENKYGKLNRNLHIQQNIHRKIKQA